MLTNVPDHNFQRSSSAERILTRFELTNAIVKERQHVQNAIAEKEIVDARNNALSAKLQQIRDGEFDSDAGSACKNCSNFAHQFKNNESKCNSSRSSYKGGLKKQNKWRRMSTSSASGLDEHESETSMSHNRMRNLTDRRNSLLLQNEELSERERKLQAQVDDLLIKTRENDNLVEQLMELERENSELKQSAQKLDAIKKDYQAKEISLRRMGTMLEQVHEELDIVHEDTQKKQVSLSMQTEQLRNDLEKSENLYRKATRDKESLEAELQTAFKINRQLVSNIEELKILLQFEKKNAEDMREQLDIVVIDAARVPIDNSKPTLLNLNNNLNSSMDLSDDSDNEDNIEWQEASVSSPHYEQLDPEVFDDVGSKNSKISKKKKKNKSRHLINQYKSSPRGIRSDDWFQWLFCCCRARQNRQKNDISLMREHGQTRKFYDR
eukprot:GHVL01028026.1.p1 GENE.GHVL01028026.1~~GHVL01028026.1.p1  ORF type:complete len:438 (+),score=104.74 GHVL01028026.1:11-1324(+)